MKQKPGNTFLEAKQQSDTHHAHLNVNILFCVLFRVLHCLLKLVLTLMTKPKIDMLSNEFNRTHIL